MRLEIKLGSMKKIKIFCFQPKASTDKSLQSIKDKLKCNPLLIQVPVYTNNLLTGIIDLINMKKVIFDPSTKGLKFAVGK